MRIENVQDALILQLRVLYSIEKQLIIALPQIAAIAISGELEEIIGYHLKETENHVNRLEDIFTSLEEYNMLEKCQTMELIIESGEKTFDEQATPEVLDILIISNLKKIEYYEIASYESAYLFADYLRLEDVADLLQETLNEELSFDQRISNIFKSAVQVSI